MVVGLASAGTTDPRVAAKGLLTRRCRGRPASEGGRRENCCGRHAGHCTAGCGPPSGTGVSRPAAGMVPRCGGVPACRARRCQGRTRPGSIRTSTTGRRRGIGAAIGPPPRCRIGVSQPGRPSCADSWSATGPPLRLGSPQWPVRPSLAGRSRRLRNASTSSRAAVVGRPCRSIRCTVSTLCGAVTCGARSAATRGGWLLRRAGHAARTGPRAPPRRPRSARRGRNGRP